MFGAQAGGIVLGRSITQSHSDLFHLYLTDELLGERDISLAASGTDV